MELLLIRHAQPQRLGHDGRDANPGLSLLGMRQARYLAEHLADSGPLSAVYTSTQRRASETATALTQRTAAPLIEEPRLLEFDHGASSYLAVDEYSGDRAAQWADVEAGRWGDHVFDVAAFRGRVRDAMERIITEHPSATVAVICHGGVINSYLGEILEVPNLMFFGPEHTSITRVAAARSGRREMLSANETAHVPGLAVASHRPPRRGSTEAYPHHEAESNAPP
jgi:probable phosphoglycerate mutase